MNYIIRTKEDKIRAKDAIDAMPLSPVQILRFSDYKKNRSRAQNDTFHQWVKLLADYSGYSMDDVKDKLVLSIWPPRPREVKVKTGGKFETYTLIERRSTTELTVEEMSHLLTVTADLAAQLDVKLPITDEYKDTM